MCVSASPRVPTNFHLLELLEFQIHGIIQDLAAFIHHDFENPSCNCVATIICMSPPTAFSDKECISVLSSYFSMYYFNHVMCQISKGAPRGG